MFLAKNVTADEVDAGVLTLTPTNDDKVERNINGQLMVLVVYGILLPSENPW